MLALLQNLFNKTLEVIKNAGLVIATVVNSGLDPYLLSALRSLLKIVTLLVAIAYYTLGERKIRGAAQRR